VRAFFLLPLLFSFFLARSEAAPLKIVNATVQQTEDGSPVTAAIAFLPGETLFLSFRVEGYGSSADKIKLTSEVDAFDPAGIKLMETISSGIEREVAPEDKEWKPILRHQIAVPPFAISGAYKLVLRVKDAVTQPPATASLELPFTVRGRDVAASEILAIRNFGFLRSEEDRTPLARPVYRPGDTVWAQFDIIGYRFGPSNQVDVTYGIRVLAPSGKELFSVKEAAREQSASYYPQRYVSGGLNLSLQPNIRPGEYLLIIEVIDRSGNQRIEHEEKFWIE
jgi:hypothetical protein